jgi:hypothetical protein
MLPHSTFVSMLGIASDVGVRVNERDNETIVMAFLDMVFS